MAKFYSALLACVFLLCSCVTNSKVVKNSSSEEYFITSDQGFMDDDWASADIVTYDHGNIVFSKKNEEVDPFEPLNRTIFKFNKVFDNLLLKPVAIIYDRTISNAGKNCIRNFLHNITTPLKIIYGIVSVDLEMASREFIRFIINTTFGTLGIHDAASRYPKFKFKAFRGDDLLKRYGGKNGPYVILPIIGPSSVRGSFGLLFDVVFDPLTYNIKTAYTFTRAGVIGIDTRADLLKLTDDVDETAIDEYVIMRNIYLQNRR